MDAIASASVLLFGEPCSALHDDGQREYAYGPAQGLPESKVGTFPQALYDQARKQGWFVVSMKDDWKKIFAFEGCRRTQP